MDLHTALGLCKFVEKKPGTIINLEETYSTDEEDLNPEKNILHGSVSILPYSDKPGLLHKRQRNQIDYIEQLPIDINIPGLMESITGGSLFNFMCVIPSCMGYTYREANMLRKHYTSHDPEMYSNLVCPICKYTVREDRPKQMKKHAMEKHGMSEDWADDNRIVEVSEKLKNFKEATKVKKGRPSKGLSKEVKKPLVKRPNQKRTLKSWYRQCLISLEDPFIRASFEEGGIGNIWTCGLPDCQKSGKLRNVYELKMHYGQHDASLRKKTYQCHFCLYNCFDPRDIRIHIKNEHKPEAPNKTNFTKKEGDGWEGFSEAANKLLENNPNQTGRGGHWEMPDFDTIKERCNICTQTFNTQNSYEDHSKVHNPDSICFNCSDCDEGFSVESVYINHVRSHSILYDLFKTGVIRCNGCSQHFSNVKEVKNHMQVNHMNLLEKCIFCEVCSDFFTTPLALRNHMFYHAEKVFRCPVCVKKKFLSQEEADDHMSQNKCSEQETFICNQCGTAFGSKFSLKTHMKSHEELIYQFQCKICQALYLTVNLIKNHIRKVHKIPEGVPFTDYFIRHSKEEAKLLDVELLNAKKPKGRVGKFDTVMMPCSYGCGGTFKKSGMNRHQRSCQQRPVEESNHDEDFNHAAQVFECPVCPNKTFTSREEAAYHMALNKCQEEEEDPDEELENGGEVFRCPVCPNKTFNTTEEAAYHMAMNKCKEEDYEYSLCASV